MSGSVSPIPGTANPEGEVDQEGSDEARAFVVQTRVFGVVGAFLFALSIGYGLWTGEAAGGVMLALAGGLATLTAAYLGWPRKGHAAPAPQVGANETPWFPAASIWPFAVAGAAFLVANGILLGLWLLLPAAVVMFFAIAGFVVQSRRRS